jgi:hypothetical protein
MALDQQIDVRSDGIPDGIDNINRSFRLLV